MALVRTQVARAIQTARAAGRMKPWHEPGAAMALILARQLDQAGKTNAIGDVVRLSDSLRKTLDALPLTDGATDDAGARREANASGAVAGNTGGLAGVVGAGAAVGDTALP